MNRRQEGLTTVYPKEYAIYRSMLQRTGFGGKPTKKNIENYISKGISCSIEWRLSFKNFMDDMGPRPEGYEIERMDNYSGYTKTNCRWASRMTNQYNRGKSKNNNSGLPKGVRFHKKNKNFTAQICIAYVSYHLGSFSTPKEASEAYNEIALEWYGFLQETK